MGEKEVQQPNSSSSGVQEVWLLIHLAGADWSSCALKLVCIHCTLHMRHTE